MRPLELTAANFDETVLNNGIVIVDFWAEWCGPCKMFAPTFEAAAEKHPEIVFGKVDTEAEQSLSAAAGIQSIPTLMVFRDQIMVFNQAGALPPEAFDQLITAVLDLNMDDVRAQLAAAQDAAEASAQAAPQN